jgi:hypothetical protein
MFVRSFPALALIHPDHIDAAFADIKERAKGFKGEGYEGMNKFMEYFEPVRGLSIPFSSGPPS